MASKLFSRILVPYDFSDGASYALQQAVALAARHGGALIVQHVVEPVVIAPEAPLGLAGDAFPVAESFVPLQRRALERVTRKAIGNRGIRCTLRVEVGHPVQSIVDASRRATMIVIATHGRTGLSHVLLGSVAERVVRHAPVPVLTVRAPHKKRR